MKRVKTHFRCKSNKGNVDYFKKQERVNDKISNKEKKA